MRPRLLPVLIVAAVLTLTVRLGGLWQDLHALGRVQGAQAGPPAAGDAGPPRTMGRSAGVQLAAAGAETEPDPPSASGADGLPTQPDSETVALPSDPFDLTDEEIELLQKLTRRREEIERRGRELEERTALLQAAERRIDEKVGELKALQSRIESLLVQHDEQEDAQMRSLVKIYESMKPKEAARIFEELDMVVLLEVIDRMNERRAAPILAKMNPNKAKAVTLRLANRRSMPPAEK